MFKSLLTKIQTWMERVEKLAIHISDEELSVKHPFPLNFIKRSLIALSQIYGSVVFIRLWLYQIGILKSRKVPCFVISIGNIVAGGSGKTPMTLYVAEMVKSMGFHPVVLSRGYGGAVEKKEQSRVRRAMHSIGSQGREGRTDERCSTAWYGCAVAGDGESLLSDPKTVGDEPFMMASRLSCPVVVGVDRFRAAMMALDLFRSKGIDVVILDDGFQHIGLQRDLDIVLLDCSRPFGNGCLLPAGRLRESPQRAMERADIAIFTRYSGDSCQEDAVDRVYNQSSSSRKKLHKGKKCQNSYGQTLSGKMLFKTSHRPFLYRFLGKAGEQPSGLNDLKGREACLFSAIADNGAFRKTVENLAVSVKAHLEFNDHHMYKNEEISMIVKTYHRVGADLMITTEKDYARLGLERYILQSGADQYSQRFDGTVYSSDDREKNIWTMDLAVVGIEIDFLDKTEDFKSFIWDRLHEI